MRSEEVLGLIPPDWEYTTLGAVCKRGGGDIQTGPFGSQLHASDYIPIGIPSIMPQNIGDNKIIEAGIVRITPTDAKRLSRYLVRKGDIVYSKKIALELTEKLRNNTTVDWQKRDSVRARLRNLVRITLRRHKYPPDKQEEAIQLVLQQAERLSDGWSKVIERN